MHGEPGGVGGVSGAAQPPTCERPSLRHQQDRSPTAMISQAAQDWCRKELRRWVGSDQQDAEAEVGLSEISHHEWQDRSQQRAADSVHDRQEQDGSSGTGNLLQHRVRR